MTIATTTNEIAYTPDGVSTAFAYPYAFVGTADLKVLIDDVLVTTGFSTTGTLPITGSGTYTSGTVTFSSAPTGTRLQIYNDPDLLQSTALPPNDPFPSKTVERSLDKLTLMVQRWVSRINLAITFPSSETGSVKNQLPAAALRANTQLTFDASGNPLCAVPTSGTAADVLVKLGDTSNITLGADLVAYFGATLADWYFGPIAAGADATGVASARAALVAADIAAAAAGRPLHVPPGTYLIDSSYTFTAPVVMAPGAKLKTNSSAVYLKFGAGFESGLYYCIDTDGPTQFLSVERIYPQWFGPCGLVGQDSSTALARAYMACRASANAATATPDAAYGCRTVHLISGVYRCNDVNVYCGTVTTGEARGSLFNSLIQQIDRTKPALRILPKNYSVTGTVLNNGVGQNFFHHMGFRSEAINDSVENSPICQFYSPAQATTLLGIGGDTAGTVGHVDTMFERCWFKDSAGSCIAADEGTLGVHVRSCIFDVVRRAIRHSGTARGEIRSANNHYYVCVRSAFENSSTDTTQGVNWFSSDDEFTGCGNPFDPTATYRRAMYYAPSTTVAGTGIFLYNPRFRKTTVSANQFGGPLRLSSAETIQITGISSLNADSSDLQKFIFIGAGVKHLEIRGQLISDALNSYTNARAVAISQSTQTLVDTLIDLKIVNTSASSFETAVQSDFVLTDADLRLSVTGNFTQQTFNITGRGVAVPVVASATTMNIPPTSPVILVSGTTAVTGITATGWAGKTVTLVFQGALTFTDGLNLKLAGNLVTTADDSITLVCDGTNFYEIARSVN